VAATQQALEILGAGQFIITTLEDRSVRAVRDWADGVGVDLLVGLSLGRDTAEMSLVEAVRTRLSEFFPAARIRGSRANLVVCHQRIAWLVTTNYPERAIGLVKAS
jgi:glycerophosphoryl diester phosphodiesterase